MQNFVVFPLPGALFVQHSHPPAVRFNRQKARSKALPRGNGPGRSAAPFDSPRSAPSDTSIVESCSCNHGQPWQLPSPAIMTCHTFPLWTDGIGAVPTTASLSGCFSTVFQLDMLHLIRYGHRLVAAFLTNLFRIHAAAVETNALVPGRSLALPLSVPVCRVRSLYLKKSWTCTHHHLYESTHSTNAKQFNGPFSLCTQRTNAGCLDRFRLFEDGRA